MFIWKCRTCGNIPLDKRLEDAIGSCCGTSKDAHQDVHNPFQEASVVADGMEIHASWRVG